MKKPQLILLAVVVAVSLVVFFRPSPSSAPEKLKQPSPAVAKARVEETAPLVPAKAPPAEVAPEPIVIPVHESSAMAAVRAAVSSGNGDALERAFASLVDFIKEHPDQVDNYVAFLESEKNEHVLRTFTLALAESEMGLLDNDKVVAAMIRLAKDPSFEQRQHIMLHLMSKAGEIRDDERQAIFEISQTDRNSQVKTSAVTVLADWMESFPAQADTLLEQVEKIFQTATDEDVRGFTYQVLALHKEKLSRELLVAVSERLKTEADAFNCNLLASALSAAPDDIRKNAVDYLEKAFSKESDPEGRRNRLAQLVCLAQRESVPFLEKTSAGDSLLAEDARQYLSMLSTGSVDAATLLMDKEVRDAGRLEPEKEEAVQQ